MHASSDFSIEALALLIAQNCSRKNVAAEKGNLFAQQAARPGNKEPRWLNMENNGAACLDGSSKGIGSLNFR